MGNILKDKNSLYMDIAERVAQQSYAERKKVGAVLVKDKNIISFGWNGTPTGFDNTCENELGETKKEVLHAEANAICKLLKEGGVSSKGADLYVTLSPCMECSKLIVQVGIENVLYKEVYRDTSSLEFLEKCGINTHKIP